jgi:hypothetical protein
MIILYILAGLIVLILLLAAIVGRAYRYEQSILIRASQDKVWNNMSTLHAINQWNPWMGIDPSMKVQYMGTDGKPGAGFSWDSPVKNVGAGAQTILRVKDRSELATRVDFERPFKSTGLGDFQMLPEGDAVRVSWSIRCKLPYPMNIIKLFGVMQKNMNKDFSKGLTQLKTLCEG